MTTQPIDRKRYVATSMNAVLEEIKKDFGDDGRIVSTREFVEGGFFGFMGTRKYEVVAVCPKKRPKQKNRARNLVSGNEFLDELLKSAKSDNLVSADDKQKKLLNTLGLVRSKGQPQDLHNDQANQILNDLFLTSDSKSLKKLSSSDSGSRSKYQISGEKSELLATNSSVNSTEDLDALKSEMKQIRMGLKELRQFMLQSPVKPRPSNDSERITTGDFVQPEKLKSSFLDSPEQLLQTDKGNKQKRANDFLKLDDDCVNAQDDSGITISNQEHFTQKSLATFEALLHTREFDRDLINTYLKVVKNVVKEKPKHSWTVEELKEALQSRYRDTVKVRPSIFKSLKSKESSVPKVMVFVGPTGVGKTTTIAKLATCLSSTENGSYKVALITIDTFKVGAVAQITYYAKGIKADLEVVFRPEEILPALQKHSDKDVILIDTVGRGPKSKMQISCLKSFLPDSMNAEIHLCMAATSRYKDMIDTIKAFNHLGVDSLLFTKLDETSTYGPMLSILQKNTRDISYVTTGQIVPGDYRVIDRSYLADLMFSESH
tara:strand:- start:207 stop:1844 length:1638 start_codon:yes stop_codon:yes gene_type:complete